MTENNKLPKWVLISREHLKNIISKIDALRKEGQAEIKRGLEKVKVANNLQQEAEYLGYVLSQQHGSQYWNDEIVMTSGQWVTNSIASFDTDLDKILGYAKAAGAADNDYHKKFAFALSTTDSSAGTAVFLSAGIEKRFQIIEPTYKPVLTDFEPKRLTSRNEIFQDLKSIIADLGEEFVSMLNGSEAALDIDSPDRQSQAAHSMRDCFQQSLERLAPKKVVESQPWFEPTEGAPGGISRRSRLRYILYGSGENVDGSTIQKLDGLTDIAKDSLDLCIARAHDHDPSLTKEEVLLAIDQARNVLLNVLKQYYDYRTR